MSAHVARPRRPRARLAVAAVAALGVTSLHAAPAEAAPERVLQNVDVRIDTAGVVTGLSSVVLRSDVEASGDPDADDVDFDPAEYADRLPVRVLTSYRTEDGRVGTDLADLDGEDGLVVIDVTVQNTTATTRLVRAETASRQVEAPALVGAPLTVVGGVTLDGDDLARVVTTPSSGEADGATSGVTGDVTDAITNGVVSRQGDDVRVQWSSFLAPPRLAGTATFRLALRAEDFEPPTFDLSVQPGLVTDPSVLGLIDTVFGDGAGSVAQLDTDTLALVGQINATLGEAATSLTEVQRALETAGDDLGTRTIDSLTSGQDLLRTELGGLITELQEVRDGATSQLDATATAVTGQVDDSLDRVLAFLGDPDTLLAQWRPRRTPDRIDGSTGPGRTGDDGCEVAVPTVDPRAPIYAQMLAIADGLQAVRDGAGACRDRIQQVISTGLDRARQRIGDAQDLLGRTLDDVEGLSTPLADAVRSRLAGGLESSLDQLVARGDEIARATDVLTRRLPSTSKADLDSAVTELGDLLTDLQGLLDLTGTGSDLDDGLAGVRADALAGAQQLVGADSVQADLAAAVQALCALPLDPAQASAAADRDAVVARLIGQDCAGAPVAGATPVSAGITAASDLLTDIAGRIDDPQPAFDPLRVIRKALQGAFTVASGVRSRLGTTKGRLDTALRGLGDELDGLREAVDAVAEVDAPGTQPLTTTVVNGECVLAGGGGGTAALDVLERDARLLLCRQQLIDATLADGLSASTAELRTATGELDEPQQALGALDTELDGRTRAVFADLFGSLARTRRDVLVCRLGAQIEQQRDALGDPGDAGPTSSTVQRRCPGVTTEADGTSVREDATAGIDDAVTSSVSLIDDRITASTGDIEGTRAQLVTSLADVLRAIGDPDGGGTGLLDTVADQVDSTGVAAADLADADAEATRFGSVREQSLLGLAQQREADRMAREQLADLGLFGLTAPVGSTTRVVYTFSVGPDNAEDD